jgi:phage portal protein BeeE
MARFPWVWTCVRAVAGDAAGLPLCAVRMVDGKRRVLDGDPIVRLLQRPSTGVTGYLLRKQLAVDYLLTGNAYIWRASEFEAIRLHPEDVEPVPMGSGLGQAIGAYKVWDGEKHVMLPAGSGVGAVLHVRDVSWESGVQALIGESAIRCLHDDLTMELGAKSLAAAQATKGRPEILLSTEGQLGPTGAKELTERWEAATKARHGAFATGRGVKATPLGWSPREFEFAARSEVVRDVVLAVFEVPPARAGLSSANYGTQKQQMRTYWESIQRRIVAFDEAFSLWCAPGVGIETDFTAVEALQVSYTERQTRVVTWVSLGATPAEAAEYEGFDEAPVGDEAPQAMQPGVRPPSRPEEPQGDKALAAYLAEAAPRYARIATAAAEGADIDLLVGWETERLFGVLSDARLTSGPADARLWAEELVAVTVEATRMAEGPVADLEAFSAARASRLAAQIREAA